MATRQRPDLATPAGHYELHQIQPELFDGFEAYGRTGNFDIATPEKALFATLHLSTRKGQRFSHLPEVEFPEEFSWDEVEEWTNRIKLAALRIAMRKRSKGLRTSGPSPPPS